MHPAFIKIYILYIHVQKDFSTSCLQRADMSIWRVKEFAIQKGMLNHSQTGDI